MRTVGRVHGIQLSLEKGKPRVSRQQGEFVAGKGLRGDARFGAKVQLVALPLESRRTIDVSQEPGLCFERFMETLTIDFEEYSPAVGDILRIGACVLAIEATGKRCFPECQILAGGRTCALATDALHLSIQKSGVITCGDEVFLEGEDKHDSGGASEEEVQKK